MDTVRFVVTDAQTQKVRRLCVMEQFRKPEIATDDPEELAFELIAPSSLLIEVSDRQPEMIETALQRMEKHIDRFIRLYQLLH